MSNSSMSRIAYKARNLVARTAGPAGLFAALRFMTRDRPRILMYHRFSKAEKWNKVSVERFREQVRYLKSRFELVTMRELGLQLQSGGIKPRQAAITVDDGYADFCELALPVLVEEDVPATFFVTTRFVDGEIWLWPDKLEFVLDRCISDPSVRCEKWSAYVDLLLDMTPPERDRWLEDFARREKIVVPDTPTDDYAACSWEQIREASESGVEIGAHTRVHPRLTNLSDALLEHEVAGSKADIESRLGGPVSSFCFPNGAPDDYDERVERAVEQAGYLSSVAAHHDGKLGGRFSLRRLGVGNARFEFTKSVSGSRFL